ncbi:MAG: zf-HC2 domain-containing protein [Acidobacteriaceae bacterium]|nr:zf-HC2 domain-containing protein [Acidobacteriaceae bacterium]
MLTCKQFLSELNDYLDDTLDPQTRSELTRHVNECPNCWVVCNTTEKTLKVFKGMEAKAVPPDIEHRLMAALEKRIADRGPICGQKKAEA